MNKSTLITIYKNPLLRAVVAAVLLSTAYTLLFKEFKPVREARLKLIDGLFHLKHSSTPLPQTAKEIVLVAIDDESLREMNMRWPWSRGVLAGIIKKLSEHSPRLVCADLAFVGESQDPAQDLILSKSLYDAKNVYAVAYFGKDGKYVLPDKTVGANLKGFGFVNKPIDSDGIVRRMRPYALSVSGKIIDYSLTLKVISDISGSTPEKLTSLVPLLKNNTAYINYCGKEAQFATVPVWKVLEEKIDLDIFKNKIVFIGVTTELFHDSYRTPFGQMSGVVININEALTYCGNSAFCYLKDLYDFIILFLFLFASMAIPFRLSVRQRTLATGILLLAFAALSIALFFNRIMMDFLGVVLLVLGYTTVSFIVKYFMIIIENVMLRNEAITDGLTHLYVYRYFELQLRREFQKAAEQKLPLCLIIFDIDHFKNVNDTYGHEFGNVALKAVSKTIKDNSKKADTVARYGGEEFCAILPDMKRESAIKYAERIRTIVKSLKFTTDKNEEVANITISAGIVANEDVSFENYQQFIKASDMALYHSKNTGRDKVSVYNKDWVIDWHNKEE